jgi:hypothetical protein
MKIDVAAIGVTRHKIRRRSLPSDIEEDAIHSIWSTAPRDDVIVDVEQAAEISAELAAEVGRIGAADCAEWAIAFGRKVRNVAGRSTRLI